MPRFLRAAALLAGVAAAAGVNAQTPLFPVFRLPQAQTSTPPKNQTPRGQIVGRVIDAATGRGVANVAVRLRGDTVAQTRLTDARGRYAISNLPAGEFTVEAKKAGYFDGAFGRMRAGGDATAITLYEGQSINDADVQLWRPAVLAGYLVDELNEPLVGVRVRALRRQFVDNHLRLVPVGSDTTDDEGAYRIFDLLPGQYVISVPTSAITVPAGVLRQLGTSAAGMTSQLLALLIGPPAASPPLAQAGTLDPAGATLTIGAQPALATPPGPVRAYPTLYFPGTPLASMATPIDLGTAEVHANVTLQLTPVTTARVSGVVAGPDGPMTGQVLRLVLRGERDLGLGFETGLTISGTDGRFLFREIPAGEYDLKAQNTLTAVAPKSASAGSDDVLNGNGVSLAVDPSGSIATTTVTGGPLGGDHALWGERSVSVLDQDLDDVNVRMEAGLMLTARAAFDGSARAPEPEVLRRVRVTLQPIDADRDAPRAFMDESGAYVIRGAAPGRYVLAVDAAPPGWTLQSATTAGRDLSASPFDLRNDVDAVTLTFTDHPAALTGTVRDAHNFAAPGAFAAVFPADDRDAVDTGVSPRRIRGMRANASGVFSFGALPPGDYWLVGLNDAIAEGWQAPDSLRMLQKLATRVTIQTSGTISRDARLIPTKPSR